jgi:glutathione synthase/RimK-type ligase-like ATP-grasp enzyme
MRSLVKAHPEKKFIIKPIEGRGGDGIHVIYHEKNEIMCWSPKETVELYDIKLRRTSIVQEMIEQHSEISKFSNAINTIRIVTLLTKADDVLFLGAKMRFGSNTSYIDNTSKGGVGVGIDLKDGTLVKAGYDKKACRFTEHPDTKKVFEGYAIPHWNDILELAAKVQKSISFNRLLGQDIAITSNGPVIIELNAEYDNVMLEQTCGPLLKNKNVRSAFHAYDLLYNRLQKQLVEA